MLRSKSLYELKMGGRMLVYRALRRGGKPQPWATLDDAVQDLGVLLRPQDPPYRAKPRGKETWGKNMTLPVTLERVKTLASKMDETGAVLVECNSAPDKTWLLDVGQLHMERPPAPPGTVSAAIAQVHDFLFTRTERLELYLGRELRVVTMGYTVCKWINGTVGGTPSQHCPGPPNPLGGNAVDFAIQRKRLDGRWEVDIEVTDRMVNDLEAQDYVAHVLWRGVANHFPGHAHVSGAPLRVGVPACLR
jgi:hypothetical protein